MIKVTDLQGRERFVNADLIEGIEANPDTQIILVTGKRIYAQETPNEIADRVIGFRQQCSNHAVPALRVLESQVGDQDN